MPIDITSVCVGDILKTRGGDCLCVENIKKDDSDTFPYVLSGYYQKNGYDFEKSYRKNGFYTYGENKDDVVEILKENCSIKRHLVVEDETFGGL